MKSRLQRARSLLKELVVELDAETGTVTAEALDDWVLSMRGRHRLPE